MTRENSDLLRKISRYAENTSDVLYLALIGSSSNNEALNDEYSDIDLILVTNSLEKYYKKDTWLSCIDDVWITFTESAADLNYWERRCVFKNGLDVDFVIVEKDKLIDANNQFPVLSDICRKTIQVLIDKKKYSEYLKRFINDKREYVEPVQDEFSNLVNDFYFHYLWAYKKCLRGEFWIALQCVNCYLKNKTLTMIEWYEHSLHGKEYNTFYQGRYFENWVEESIKKEIENIHSEYGKDNIIKALDANRILFTRIAKETSRMYKLIFPEQKVEMLAEWVSVKYKNG